MLKHVTEAENDPAVARVVAARLHDLEVVAAVEPKGVQRFAHRFAPTPDTTADAWPFRTESEWIVIQANRVTGTMKRLNYATSSLFVTLPACESISSTGWRTRNSR